LASDAIDLDEIQMGSPLTRDKYMRVGKIAILTNNQYVLKTVQDRCIDSVKGQQEVVCVVLNSDIAVDIGDPNHPKFPLLLCFGFCSYFEISYPVQY